MCHWGYHFRPPPTPTPVPHWFQFWGRKIEPTNSNPVYLKSIINIILSYRPNSSKRSPSSGFSTSNTIWISLLYHACHMSRQSHNPNVINITSSEEQMARSSSLCTFLPYWANSNISLMKQRFVVTHWYTILQQTIKTWQVLSRHTHTYYIINLF